MRIGGIDFSMGVDLTKNSAGHHFFSASDHSNNSSLSANYENVRHTLSEIKGESEAMEKVLQTVSKVARSDSPVLINGDSGTGKELIARAIHRLSPRVSRRFVAINCSAILREPSRIRVVWSQKGCFHRR